MTSSTSNIVNRTDVTTNNSPKSVDTLRPHYYTTFQNNCCESKTNSTTTTQGNERLPIPIRIKEEAEDLLQRIHSVLIQDLCEVTTFSSIIPELFFEVGDEFHMQRYLIDRGMLKTLKDANTINWNHSLKQLYPIRTSGDGNCLLHAILIAMIGIHDFNLFLRDRLAQFMDENKDILKNYWRTERLKSDKSYGIHSEDSKLNDEWDEVCKLVHYERSADGQTAIVLEFLEAVHIFAIANMLRRPIIVLSEDVIRNIDGEPFSVNDLFGIYLPILSIPADCIKEPILLAYDHSHFCPLQTNNTPFEKTAENLLPLYLSIQHMHDQVLLPIRFLGDDISTDRSDKLLQDYLKVRKAKYRLDSTSVPTYFMCAELSEKHPVLKENFFLLYHKYLIDYFQVQEPRAIEEKRQRERQRQLDNYVSSYSSYDINGRPAPRQDPLSTFTPRSTTSTNDTQPYYQSRSLYDTSYNGGAYVPSNGVLRSENPSTPLQQSGRPVDATKATQSNSDVNYEYYDSYVKSYRPIYSANIDNLKNNGRSINTPSIDRQDRDSSRTRERTVIEIPVQHIKPRTSTNNPDLFISEQRTAATVRCYSCNRLFEDTKYKNVCPDCDVQYPASHSTAPSWSPSRSLHSPRYNPDSYTSTLPSSSLAATRTSRTIHCPICGSLNLFTNRLSSASVYCSTCRNLIPSSYNY